MDGQDRTASVNVTLLYGTEMDSLKAIVKECVNDMFSSSVDPCLISNFLTTAHTTVDNGVMSRMWGTAFTAAITEEVATQSVSRPRHP